MRNLLCAMTLVVVVFGAAASAQAQQCGPMDVVFVIDNTGSMTEVISEVQTQVNNIADAVAQASGGDYQFGLVVEPQDNVVVLLDMAPKNRTELAAAVAKMATAGSCGEPAAWDEGINTVLHNLAGGRTGTSGSQTGDFKGQFRANATKIIITITDARPGGLHGCDYQPGVDDANVHNYAVEASSRDIKIASVFVPTTSAVTFGETATITQIMQDMAAVSDGIYVQTASDASDLGQIIESIIASCGGGSTSLLVDPTDVFVSTGDTVDVKVTNYRPTRNNGKNFYNSFGLPTDSTATFSALTPTVKGTDVQNLRLTIGPDTPAGTYVQTISARTETGTTRFNYVLVHVDCTPPFIYGTPNAQPNSQSVAGGSTAKLNVVPSGNGPFKYQWYAGHTGNTSFPIAGATTAALTTPAVLAPSDYWVRVSNGCGSVDSQTATVTPR